MHESLSFHRDRSRYEFLTYSAQFDDPAFLRRARSVAAAWEGLLSTCRSRREELLTLTRMRLAIVGQLVQLDWRALGPHLEHERHVRMLAEWHEEWQPRLRGPVEPTRSARKIRSALRELIESVGRFNEKWQSCLLSIDRTTINRLRHDYNRYYVLEKACALQSETLAAAGFVPLPPVTVEQLTELFPLLEVPQLRR